MSTPWLAQEFTVSPLGPYNTLNIGNPVSIQQLKQVWSVCSKPSSCTLHRTVQASKWSTEMNLSSVSLLHREMAPGRLYTQKHYFLMEGLYSAFRKAVLTDFPVLHLWVPWTQLSLPYTALCIILCIIYSWKMQSHTGVRTRLHFSYRISYWFDFIKGISVYSAVLWFTHNENKF